MTPASSHARCGAAKWPKQCQRSTRLAKMRTHPPSPERPVEGRGTPRRSLTGQSPLLSSGKDRRVGTHRGRWVVARWQWTARGWRLPGGSWSSTPGRCWSTDTVPQYCSVFVPAFETTHSHAHRPTAPPPPPPGMPAVVRRPACHSRRFKGERPMGAATG